MPRLSKQNQRLLDAIAAAPTPRIAPLDGTDQAGESAAVPATVGVGVDITEIARIQRCMDRHAGFAERVFTPRERAYAAKKAKPAQHLAAFWAAREAALKAMGCGFRDVDFYDVSVGHDDKGKPVLLLSGLAYRIAQDQAIASFELSISHTADVAIANVVALRKPTPKPAAPIDDKTRLLLDFKRLRTLLDELESKNVESA